MHICILAISENDFARTDLFGGENRDGAGGACDVVASEVVELFVELLLQPVLEVDERLARLSGSRRRQVAEHAFEPLDHVALRRVQGATLVQETKRFKK